MIETTSFNAYSERIVNPMITLRPYQRAGVQWLLGHRRGLLADEPGLGKTAQALVALHAAGGYPALVVCPSAVKTHWAHQALKWIGQRSQIISHGKDAAAGYPITICNYELLKVVVDTAAYHTIIADEFFYCKSEAAQRTKAVKALSRGATNFWALSGTPIINRPMELVSQLDILGYLQNFGGKFPFLYRYCNPTQKMVWVPRWDAVERRVKRKQIQIMDYTGSARLTELHERLTQYCMLRRLKKEVLTELPDQQSIPLEIDLDAAGRKLYNAARQDLAQWVRENKGDAAVWRMRANERLVKLNYMRQVAAQAKLPRLIACIEDLLETGEKLVLFAFSRALQAALLKQWPQAAKILGDSSSRERQGNIDRFVRDPHCKILVASLMATAIGTDGLQHGARYAVFCDLGDHSKVHEQAIDRLHRMGQQQDVTAYYAVAQDTIEEHIMDRLITKHSITSIVADGKVVEELLEAA